MVSMRMISTDWPLFLVKRLFEEQNNHSVKQSRNVGCENDRWRLAPLQNDNKLTRITINRSTIILDYLDQFSFPIIGVIKQK
jgi:hypothetical protein